MQCKTSLKAILEFGCGWLPYWLWRLDREYEDLQWEVAAHVKMKPSQYFLRQCFIASEPSEPYLAQLIDAIASENLILGSDYPLRDRKPGVVTEVSSATFSVNCA